MRIICVGQSAYDITLPLDHYPVENKKIRVSDKIECGGGSASNCAYLLAKWGLETYFAGVVGDDYYGNRIFEEFKEIGVNTKYLISDKEFPTTASYIIANTTDGTRTILTNRHPEIKMHDLEIEDKFDVILLDGYEFDFAKQLIEKNPDAIKIIDAGSLKEKTIELCHMVDYIVCSKDFAEDYTKKKVDYKNTQSLIEIHQDMQRDFNKKIVITLEDKGSFTYDDGYKWAPSIKVKAVDSTGAGDIYHGAFTYGIAKKIPLEKILLMSNIAGALSVEKIGGRFSVPTLEEVESKYDEHNVS